MSLRSDATESNQFLLYRQCDLPRGAKKTLRQRWDIFFLPWRRLSFWFYDESTIRVRQHSQEHTRFISRIHRCNHRWNYRIKSFFVRASSARLTPWDFYREVSVLWYLAVMSVRTVFRRYTSPHLFRSPLPSFSFFLWRRRKHDLPHYLAFNRWRISQAPPGRWPRAANGPDQDSV